ncbi:glucose 1-dehydrogenase [Sphingopyxis sp. FD7]|uniref:glucose 1-dehydrogenase n=1 Tax=Sphingopyxis sp. FD7 TaxID=1914525 RepID=UPI000DC629D8|nr:glucose 1-dehydrogenase [Sphingopyxis sp. FD7]BBB14007.1 dehydrogenase [Sphingopyxis sp. FD7]
MSGRLVGKVALVTGGARGIGNAICRALALEGAAVVVTDVIVDEGRVLVDQLASSGHKAVFHRQDVTSEPGWDEIFEIAGAALGPINIVVNNAGIAIPGSIEDQTFEAWRKTMAVNLDAVFLGTRAAVRSMKQRGGAIINVSSIEGIVGNPHVPAYNASKGGVRLLTKSAALHCARSGYPIRINSLHPGYVATPLVIDALPLLPDDFGAQALARTPMGRFGETDEIARAVVFLASDDSSYMTGAELIIDGGYTA